MRTLILGGARSGKSRLAQRLAIESGQGVVFIATARALDEEMRDRIARHRAARPAAWRVIEEPLALAEAIERHAAPDACVVVDCLTLWLTNLLSDEDPSRFAAERDALLRVVESTPSRLLLVSNETGLGVVPTGALTRRFIDQSGWLHQALAERCDRVVLTVAGLPTWLKGAP